MAKLSDAGLGAVGAALAFALIPQIAVAQTAPSVGAPPVPTTMAPARSAPVVGRAAPTPTPAMSTGPARWSDVPGGMQAYRQPGYGYQLPRYWVQPRYLIADHAALGLPAPAAGFGWSRYYDDVVLTDRFGRVYDWRERGGYGRGEDYADSYGYREDDRARQSRRERRGERYHGTTQRRAGGQYSYDGRWTGSWDGGPVRTFDGRFDGAVRSHWSSDSDHYGPHHGAGYGYGYGGGETVTTTTVVSGGTPVVTRSVSYVTEHVRVAARRHVRPHKPRAKPRCTVVCCVCK